MSFSGGGCKTDASGNMQQNQNQSGDAVQITSFKNCIEQKHAVALILGISVWWINWCIFLIYVKVRQTRTALLPFLIDILSWTGFKLRMYGLKSSTAKFAINFGSRRLSLRTRVGGLLKALHFLHRLASSMRKFLPSPVPAVALIVKKSFVMDGCVWMRNVLHFSRSTAGLQRIRLTAPSFSTNVRSGPNPSNSVLWNLNLYWSIEAMRVSTTLAQVGKAWFVLDVGDAILEFIGPDGSVIRKTARFLMIFSWHHYLTSWYYLAMDFMELDMQCRKTNTQTLSSSANLHSWATGVFTHLRLWLTLSRLLW